jgi:hypothetical protein
VGGRLGRGGASKCGERRDYYLRTREVSGALEHSCCQGSFFLLLILFCICLTVFVSVDEIGLVTIFAWSGLRWWLAE